MLITGQKVEQAFGEEKHGVAVLQKLSVQNNLVTNAIASRRKILFGREVSILVMANLDYQIISSESVELNHSAIHFADYNRRKLIRGIVKTLKRWYPRNSVGKIGI